MVSEMRSTTASGDLARFHDLDVKFHRKIWDLAGNEYLTKALEATSFQLFAFALLDLGPDLIRPARWPWISTKESSKASGPTTP